MAKRMNQPTNEHFFEAYTIAHFCKVYDLSTRSLYRAWALGRGPCRRKCGGRVLIGRADARAWFDDLEVA